MDQRRMAQDVWKGDGEHGVKERITVKSKLASLARYYKREGHRMEWRIWSSLSVNVARICGAKLT